MTRKGNQPWENYVNGYPSLSSFIASDQDQSTYIFRKFKRTTARNLLYLEAELSELEAQQDKYDEEDLRNGDLDTAKRWARSWPEFSSLQNSSSPNPYQIDRLELVYKMRKLQKEYHEALFLFAEVAKLESPNLDTVEALKIWSSGRRRTCNVGPILIGQSAQRLEDEEDLVALQKPKEYDLLFRFVAKYLKVFFVEGGVNDSLAHISETRIARATAVIGTTVGATLLIGSIINLYLVQNNTIRIGLIGGYTAVFAMSISILTNARRVELFASTAA